MKNAYEMEAERYTEDSILKALAEISTKARDGRDRIRDLDNEYDDAKDDIERTERAAKFVRVMCSNGAAPPGVSCSSILAGLRNKMNGTRESKRKENENLARLADDTATLVDFLIKRDTE